ncbi:MAG TPA: sodium:dicarboxylate symporter [Nitrospina sp.]|jgi:Na+/H+-dicarboxylate symporter|nr:sodium:dicarboxylate symporter [Nitrospina sp.]|tara:strand:+ start:1910 stop:3142 length:1233 start_codon:yes stop_codon:yes gene_type:complete
MKKNGLLYLMVAGIVLGIFCGWMFGNKMLAVEWIGEMFLDALKMLVVPLIISSMIVGIAGLGDIRKVGKTGFIALSYFLITTCIAVGIGLVMVNIIEPGVAVEMTVEQVPDKVVGKESVSITDILKTFVTPNLVQSMANMEILPLIMFSLVFGGVLTTLGEPGKRAIDFFDTVNVSIMKIVHLLMYFAPIGVFALIASKLGAAGGGDLFLAELAKIGKYVTTVVSALLIHGFVILPVILYVITRRNPVTYFKNVLSALTTAFSTASSSATLPITIECAEENNRISRKSCLFVLPLAATVNMNGTALYESVAAMFIAQMLGIQLGLGDQMIIFLTATLAGIGAAGIPEAGLVTMVMVLQSVGLPLEGIGMLLSIDWFLDRCRTTINVWGDSIGAGVLDNLEEKWVERGGRN